MIDLILTGGTVVTMDKMRRVIKNGAVAVDKGAILYAGGAGEVKAEYPLKETIDCAGHVIMPRFIDAHL